jgi:hypothetical protein
MLLISKIRKSQTVRTELCIRSIVVNCYVDLKVICKATQVTGRSSSHDHAVSRSPHHGSFCPRDWQWDRCNRLVSELFINPQLEFQATAIHVQQAHVTANCIRQCTQLTASSIRIDCYGAPPRTYVLGCFTDDI